MKIGVASHCTIDSIILDNMQYDVAGGPACYCALTAKNLKFDVELYTKHGIDFPLSQELKDFKISTDQSVSEKKTTRFKIFLDGSNRKLFIEELCQKIDFVASNTDGLIISPVFNEISLDIFSKFKNNSDFIMLDPQGFLRRKTKDNEIFLEKSTIDLSKISVIKTNYDEIQALTGQVGDDAMKLLQNQGIENIILTNKQEITLLVKDKIYSINLPNLKLHDTTGIGDIFCSTFCCTMLKEKDFLWALCFAGGAAQAAIENKKFGLEKIPQKTLIENNGSYFYNMVKFRTI
tara:strand:+ start:4191 stop:5063 length:873 start_codon:yes stop_codon:yes gene_type:complete